MENKLKELANKRITLTEYKAQVKDAEKTLQQFQPFVHLQNMKDKQKELQGEVDTLAGQIKNDAEIEFVNTGRENKKPYDGIQIKKFQVVHMLDEQDAKIWMAENSPGGLTIKKSVFNKIATAVAGLKFVEVTEEYRAQIASDLSMYEELENE